MSEAFLLMPSTVPSYITPLHIKGFQHRHPQRVGGGGGGGGSPVASTGGGVPLHPQGVEPKGAGQLT